MSDDYQKFFDLAASSHAHEVLPKLPPLIVFTCPDCFHDSIGPRAKAVRCSRCGKYHSLHMLELMVSFGPQRGPWVRDATPEEQTRQQVETWARYHEREARRLRRQPSTPAPGGSP